MIGAFSPRSIWTEAPSADLDRAADQIKITHVPIYVREPGEVELTGSGLTRYRKMTLAELEKEFPKA